MAQLRKIRIVRATGGKITLEFLAEHHGTHAANLLGAMVSRDVGRNTGYLPDDEPGDAEMADFPREVSGTALDWLKRSENHAWLNNYWHGVLAAATIGGEPNFHGAFDPEEDRRRLSFEEDVVVWAYFGGNAPEFASLRRLYFATREIIDIAGPVEIFASDAGVARSVTVEHSAAAEFDRPVELWMAYDDEAMNYTMVLLETADERPPIALRESNWPQGLPFERVAESVKDTHTFDGRKLSRTYMRLLLHTGLTKKLLAFRWMLSLVSGQAIKRTGYQDSGKYKEFAEYFDGMHEATKAEIVRCLAKRFDDKPKEKSKEKSKKTPKKKREKK